MNVQIKCCLISLVILIAGCQSAPVVSTAAQKPKLSTPPQVSPLTLKTDAMTIIQLGLTDKNAYLRNFAIQVIIETNQKQFVPKIRTMLSDSSVAVRFTAAAALGEMNCKTCIDDLKKTLDDSNPNIQIAAAYSLVKMGDTAYLPKILDAAVSSDEKLRANALLLIGKLQNKEHLKLCYQALHDSTAADSVRLQAVDSIAMMKDTRIYRGKLWALLISKYADDRVMGIRAMGALGSEEAKNAIMTMLQDDVQEVRLAAADELGKMGSLAGMEQIVSYFGSNPDLNQATMGTATAVSALGSIPSDKLTGYLPAALESSSPYIRLVAAQSVLKHIQ